VFSKLQAKAKAFTAEKAEEADNLNYSQIIGVFLQV